jgi:glycosyltransferase involved in cell wall biosynthesis
VDRSRLRKLPTAIDLWQFGDDVKPVKMTDRRGFVFLSVLDWGLPSGWDVLVRAFVEEFKPDEDVGLTLKFLLPQDLTPQGLAEEIRNFLKGTLKLSSPIPKLDIHLDPVCPGLYRAMDAFVSPCRAGGLGRHLMEAMVSGLPVIATGWGGQTEFMNSENAYLLQYSLADVPDSVVAQSPQLEGSRWAEPSVEHLRSLMRQVFENRAEAKQKGQKAREHIAVNYSRERVAQQVKERLEAIFGQIGPRMNADKRG